MFAHLSSYCLLRSGEDGIRTHVPVRTNGFQDRLVMTASIPLQRLLSRSWEVSLRRVQEIFYQVYHFLSRTFFFRPFSEDQSQSFLIALVFLPELSELSVLQKTSDSLSLCIFHLKASVCRSHLLPYQRLVYRLSTPVVFGVFPVSLTGDRCYSNRVPR